jgi:hypothetical protein
MHQAARGKGKGKGARDKNSSEIEADHIAAVRFNSARWFSIEVDSLIARGTADGYLGISVDTGPL